MSDLVQININWETISQKVLIMNHSTMMLVLVITWYILAYIIIVYVWQYKNKFCGEIDYNMTIFFRVVLWVLSPFLVPIIFLFGRNIAEKETK